MEITRRRRLRSLANHWLFVVLLVALTGLLAHIAHEYRIEHDLTRSHRNTLSAATLEVLKRLEGPLAITAYALARGARGEQVHREIEDLLRPYQRAKPDLTVTLIDPREQPRAAAEAGVRAPIELVLTYQRRTERLAEFSEQALANALLRLARGSERLVLWLDGHGERKLNGPANHDLGEFGRQLELKGFRVSGVNLALAQEVPANAALLVVSSPQVPLLDGEVQELRRYLARGGNLLWLIDAEPLRGLGQIAEMLGLVLTPGIVADPAAARYGAPLAHAIAAVYGRHAVTDGFNLITVYPEARQIETIENDEWRARPLIEVAPRGCVKTGKLEGPCDKSRDIPGPIIIATAFERAVGDRQQRVVVVGNGHFLSNAFIGIGGNRELGVNMVNWLAGDDRMIVIQPREATDGRVDIDQATLYLIAFGFLIALPLAFMLTGFAIWWRRRRI